MKYVLASRSDPDGIPPSGRVSGQRQGQNEAPGFPPSPEPLPLSSIPLDDSGHSLGR